jgi:hypothetical protein
MISISIGERDFANGPAGVADSMQPRINLLADMLSGKTPEAMYDELHAKRYLSEKALQHPNAVLDLIKATLMSSRQRQFLPATKLDRVAHVLVQFGYLNENGAHLATHVVTVSEQRY